MPDTVPPDTFTGLLRRNAEIDTPEGLRFVSPSEQDTVLPWPELYARALRVAGGLRARGVVPGDLVALVLPTSPGFFDAFFGVQLAGAVPVPLYPPVRLGRLDEYHARTAAMLTAVRARMVLADGRTWRILGESVLRAKPPLGCVRLEEVSGAPCHHEAQPQDLALVQFSSGTTVDPKPVALSHANLVANVRAILSVILAKLAPGVNLPAGVTWLPLYHDMGLIGCVGPALALPGSLYLLAPEQFLARPALWLRTLSRARALVSPAPNFAFSYCVDRIRDEELDGVDLSGWAWALNGAEPVAPETLRRFVARFSRWGFSPAAMTPVYGLAEATLAVSFSEHGKGLQTRRFDRDGLAVGTVSEAEGGVELVSVGRPLPGIEVAVTEGAVGPIRVRGPSIMTGYLNRPDLTEATLKDGWLDTGDLGFRHDGELYVTGRAKDVVVLRGQNHAPHEVEQALDAVNGVRRGCVAAVGHRPEGAEGEQLWVLVEVLPDQDPALLKQTILDAVRAATALTPDRVELVAPGTLPRTSSGKIRRGEALRQLLAGTLSPPAPVGVIRLAGAMVSGTLAHWRAGRDRDGR